MDRTIIIPHRAEEKQLSHILYDAIQALILLHPSTESLRKCLSEEMFIKPNQQAFFHIMHYLFCLLDSREFKKRFFWPLTDKRSESNFRTNTVEYLKHLNEKHQLKWTNIKSYLVVMPGGMKFIKFLLDFVHFITRELIKQKEKQLSFDSNNYRSEVYQANLWKMCKKNEIFKDMASEFLDTLDTVNTIFDNKAQKLMKQLEIFSRKTGLSVDILTDDKFLKNFEEQNCQVFKQYYSERTKKVLEMESLVAELKKAMDNFYSKESGYKYDKQQTCLQLQRICDYFPIKELVEESIGSKVTDEGININTLISTFNAIIETIQQALKTFNEKPSAAELVLRLLSIKNTLQELETQTADFKKILHANAKKSKTDFFQTPVRITKNGPTTRNLENNLLMKLISTPPIKLELPEGGGKSRLSLMDCKTVDANETLNNFLAPTCFSTIRQSNRIHSLVDQSLFDLNNTMSRSKLIDPMQLLRLTTPPTKSHQSPFTPFGSNDRTRISRSQYNLDTSSIVSGDNSVTISYDYAKKLSAVKKVQDASLNFANLSTSPSGRLEPLVTVDDFNIPKLKLNDTSLVDLNSSFNCSESQQKVVNTPVDNVNVYTESNPNTSKIIHQNMLRSGISEENAI